MLVYDTDILALLIYCFQPYVADIFLFSTASKSNKTGQKIVCLKNATDARDPFITENTFFTHA